MALCARRRCARVAGSSSAPAALASRASRAGSSVVGGRGSRGQRALRSGAARLDTAVCRASRCEWPRRALRLYAVDRDEAERSRSAVPVAITCARLSAGTTSKRRFFRFKRGRTSGHHAHGCRAPRFAAASQRSTSSPRTHTAAFDCRRRLAAGRRRPGRLAIGVHGRVRRRSSAAAAAPQLAPYFFSENVSTALPQAPPPDEPLDVGQRASPAVNAAGRAARALYPHPAARPRSLHGAGAAAPTGRYRSLLQLKWPMCMLYWHKP